MSVYLIEYRDGAKVMSPVTTREKYLQLRSLAVHKDRVERIRSLTPNPSPQGEGSMEEIQALKKRLIQFNYSCIPDRPSPDSPLKGEGLDGTGLLKGCKTPSTSVGVDIDHLKPEEMEATKERILAKKDEIGLLMLERSVRCEGYHLVCKRVENLSQEDNIKHIADILGIEPDWGAKDITRVFFATTDSDEDLLYLDDKLFEIEEAPLVVNSEKLTVKSLSDEQGISLPLPKGGGGKGGEAVASLPYHKIIPAFFQMECQTYPEVPEGTRNDTLFNVTAKYLRYCTDHSFARIKALLYPDYAFGLNEQEMDSIVRSALSRERSYTPKAVKHILRKYGSVASQQGEDGGKTEDDGKPYRDLDMCIIDEVGLPQMPRWVNIMLKVAPPGYRFPTLAAVTPAMMTLLTEVSVRFGKKRQTRLNGWTHVDGPPASNKSICLSPIPYLMKHLQEEDDRNQAREDEYIRKTTEAKNKKEQPKEPTDIVIRILPANTSRLEHIKRMADAKGKHTYTYCEEIQSLNMTSGSQYHNRSDFMQLLFDNGMTGNQSFTQSSIRVRCPVCWNISTSGTRDQTLRTFRNATNGAITRVFFCLVPDNTDAPMPDYVQYTEEDQAYLERAGAIMMQMNGLVNSPKIDKALYEWVEKTRQESLGDNERLILKNRSADIAHHFAVTMHLAWIVQNIMDTEDREGRKIEVRDLDLNQYSERQSVVDLALYAADQCLDSQYRLWAKKMKQQLEAAYEGTAVFKRSDGDFIELPDEFSYSTLADLFPDKKPTTIRKMIERFKAAGKITKGERDAKGLVVFKKVKSL